MRESPNPGSAEAREKGCICPRMDNNNGRFAPYPPDGWFMVVTCPLHSPEIAGSDEPEGDD